LKQLGNLALVCAKRPDTRLLIDAPIVMLYVDRALVGFMQWDDDAKIKQMILELNFGKYKEKGD